MKLNHSGDHGEMMSYDGGGSDGDDDGDNNYEITYIRLPPPLLPLFFPLPFLFILFYPFSILLPPPPPIFFLFVLFFPPLTLPPLPFLILLFFFYFSSLY